MLPPRQIMTNGKAKNIDSRRLIKQKSEKGSVYSCDVCGKTEKRPWKLKRHRAQNHSKVRTCKVCGEDFFELEAWSLHMKTCFYTCDQCDYREKRLSRYEGHKRRHVREKFINKEDQSYTQRTTVIYK